MRIFRSAVRLAAEISEPKWLRVEVTLSEQIQLFQMVIVNIATFKLDAREVIFYRNWGLQIVMYATL
jgi:hypothetical protein